MVMDSPSPNGGVGTRSGGWKVDRIEVRDTVRIEHWDVMR